MNKKVIGESDVLFDRVWEEYIVSQMEAEIEIYKTRILRLDTAAQIYFNSSPLKNVFARAMVVARLKNKPLSITQLASQLLVTRQAISTMVQECLDKQWIVLVEIRGREKTYYGSASLVNETNKYVNVIYDLVGTSLYKAYGIVKDLDDLRVDSEHKYIFKGRDPN